APSIGSFPGFRLRHPRQLGLELGLRLLGFCGVGWWRIIRRLQNGASGGGVVQADAHHHAVVPHGRGRYYRRMLSRSANFFSLPSIFLLDSNGIISPHNLYLNPKLIVQQYEIWRLVTNFLYFRKMGRWCKRSISVNRVRVIDLVVILLLTFLCDRFYWGSLFLLAAVRGWTSWYAT
ncbi:hypothetical protein GW17_00041163, partial [Ensete ventricosum]